MDVDLISFISIKSNQDKLGKDFKNLSSVISWFGTKRYITFSKEKGWGIRDLNIIGRFVRYIFGCYVDTHLCNIYQKMKIEKIQHELKKPSAFSTQRASWLPRIFTENSDSSNGNTSQNVFPNGLVEKIENSWQKTYGPSRRIKKMGEFRIAPADVAIHFTEAQANEQYSYNRLTRDGTNLDPSIYFRKYRLHAAGIKDSLLFDKPKPQYQYKPGTYAYPSSAGNDAHWTVNFATARLFNHQGDPHFNQEPRIEQGRHQVLEHPGLYHLRVALENRDPLGNLRPDEVALISGARRYCNYDILQEVADRRSIYQHGFPTERPEQINAYQRLNSLTESNIFSVYVPRIPVGSENRAYQEKNLQQLFNTFYLAFSSIRSECSNFKRLNIHTGDWGSEIFGNDPKTVALMQLAAARFSGIEVLNYYPIYHQDAYNQAIILLDEIERANPMMTLGEFLTHLDENAMKYGLIYRRSS